MYIHSTSTLVIPLGPQRKAKPASVEWNIALCYFPIILGKLTYSCQFALRGEKSFSFIFMKTFSLAKGTLSRSIVDYKLHEGRQDHVCLVQFSK